MMRRLMRLSVFRPKSRKVKDSVSTIVFYTGYGYGWNVLDQYNFNYRKGGFDLSGMLYGKKGYTEDRKTITQKNAIG